jgi:hypothetical protein
MMVSRRRWHLVAVLVAAASPAWVLGADLPKAASDLAGAHGRDAAAVRDLVLRDAPKETDTIARDKYAGDVARALGGLLDSENPDARLNTSIIIHELGTLSTDSILRKMLTNKDPVVRYWGAKGLGNIATNLKRLGGAALTGAINDLRKQATAEKEGVVEQEIIRTLIQYGDVEGVINGIENINSIVEKVIPERGALDALAIGAAFLEKSIGGAPAAEKERAAGALARAASFTAQQQMNLKMAQGDAMPAGYGTAVNAVVDAAVRAMGAAAGKAFPWTPGTASTSPEELWLKLPDVVGSGSKKGALQTALPKVGVPPQISTPQSRPGGA